MISTSASYTIKHQNLTPLTLFQGFYEGIGVRNYVLVRTSK